MTPETQKAIEDIGAVFQDAGRALRVSSHVIKRAAVLELLQLLSASLRDLAVRLRDDHDVDEPLILPAHFMPPKKPGSES